jgi:hypothetical protein
VGSCIARTPCQSLHVVWRCLASREGPVELPSSRRGFSRGFLTRPAQISAEEIVLTLQGYDRALLGTDMSTMERSTNQMNRIRHAPCLTRAAAGGEAAEAGAPRCSRREQPATSCSAANVCSKAAAVVHILLRDFS